MDTIDPAPGSDELLEGTEALEPAQTAPPVVAIVVTRDPGPSLEETLAALAGQDYPALSVLVLDDDSAEDPTPRIAAAMPRAFVRRRSGASGFAAAANEALEAVEGAVFLCFCRDDVAPDPDAIRLMVEEAYRSNAGIVGPKVVDGERPEILLEVGMTVDHYGVPYSGIEPDEVDQQQHDAVRDVFFVSHGVTLVRADLFHELGGFDPATAPGADALDLCWRARLAGARVIVAPAARVRRCRRGGPGRRRARAAPPGPTAVRDETASRLRVLYKAYSVAALAWVLPVAYALLLAEALGLLVTGRGRRATALGAGALRAFGRPQELRAARAATQSLRRVDDGDIRDLMIRGSARLRTFVLERGHPAERLVAVSSRTRARLDDATRQLRRVPVVVGVVLAVVVLFGVRALLFGRVPEVGSFRSWPGTGAAWSALTGSWRASFMGSATPATPAFGLIALLDAVTLGHHGLARSLVVGGALPLGAWGAFRLVRPFAASPLPGVAAALAYAANPVARNAIWHGRLGPLVCFALAPFALAVVIRRTDGSPPAGVNRQRHAVVSLALLAAVVTAVWPPGLLLPAVFALAFGAAVPFVGDGPRAVRVAVLALAGTAGAVLLCTPWLWTLAGADGASAALQLRDPVSFGRLLRFHTGRAGGGFAPWGILAAAAVPLVIARADRLAWTMRAWSLAVVSYLLAWLPGQVAPGSVTPAPEGVLVAAALGLAFAAGLGVAAILDDLRRFHFGWRQVSTFVATFGLVVAFFGFAADTPSGRFGLGAGDWPSEYGWMRDDAPPGGFRVLWLGDASVLPADAKLARSTGYALTRDGAGDARALWAAPETAADRVVARAIDAAAAGDTARLGHLLAPAGVRYIALVRRAAPESGPRGAVGEIGAALAQQLDLTLSRSADAGVLYTNEAWFPAHAVVAPGSTAVRVDERDPFAAALRSSPEGVAGVPVRGGRTDTAGPGTLLWSEAAARGWRARAGGEALERRDAFGWTNAFTVGEPARVAVGYRASALVGVLRASFLLLWIAAAVAWFATRRADEEQA
jgi:hypothetical protein